MTRQPGQNSDKRGKSMRNSKTSDSRSQLFRFLPVFAGFFHEVFFAFSLSAFSFSLYFLQNTQKSTKNDLKIPHLLVQLINSSLLNSKTAFSPMLALEPASWNT